MRGTASLACHTLRVNSRRRLPARLLVFAIALAALIIGALLMRSAIHFRGTAEWAQHRTQFATGVLLVIAAGATWFGYFAPTLRRWLRQR